MARINNNIIEISSVGVAIKESETRIISISAIASADSSKCIIQDGDGMTVARFESSVTNKRTYAPLYLDRKSVKGINCVVFDNMELVVIHTG